MHDAKDMYYKKLAARVRFFKETEKGRQKCVVQLKI